MKARVTLTLILIFIQLISFSQNHLDNIINNLELQRLDSLYSYFYNAKSSSDSTLKGDLTFNHVEFKRLEKDYVRIKLRFGIVNSVDYSDGIAVTVDNYIIDLIRTDSVNVIYSRLYGIPNFYFYHRNKEDDILHIKIDTSLFHELYNIHDSIYNTTTIVEYQMPSFMEPSLFSYFDRPYEKRFDEQERVNRFILTKDLDSLNLMLRSFNYEAKAYAICGFYTLKEFGNQIDKDTEKLINKTLNLKGDVKYCYDRHCRGSSTLHALLSDTYLEEWSNDFKKQYAKELNIRNKK